VAVPTDLLDPIIKLVGVAIGIVNIGEEKKEKGSSPLLALDTCRKLD